MKRYFIKTLGCQMNVHDSERIAGILENLGYEESIFDPIKLKGSIKNEDHNNDNQKKALPIDIYIINTCSVRENAASHLYGLLGQLAEINRENQDMKIVVGGCQAQQDRDIIFSKAPWVDIVFGTNTIDKLPNLIKNSQTSEEKQIAIENELKIFPSTLPRTKQVGASAWVSISVGCNNFCSFCIVPYLRGREKDREIEDIIEEIEQLIKKGVKEITLLGQNVNTYGVGLRNSGNHSSKHLFAKLLDSVAKIDGLERLRYMSPYPSAFTDDVIEVMKNNSNIQPYIHMPLQSGSDKILKKMRRGYDTNKFREIISKIRKTIPDIAISTDIILGFPDERDSDFNMTYDFVKEMKFDLAYIFLYSRRPNTPAASWDKQIEKEIVKKRFDKLLELQEDLTLQKMKTFENRDLEVLINSTKDKIDNETGKITRTYTGRDPYNHLVHISTDKITKVEVGDIVIAKITHSAPHHLLGKLMGTSNNPFTNYEDKIFVKSKAEEVPATCAVTGNSSNKGVDKNISLETGGVVRSDHI